MDHFKGVFSASGNQEAMDRAFRNPNVPIMKKLTRDQMLDLERPISKQEVRATVFQLGKDKSPGSDGFTAEFFQLNWKDIGGQVFKAVCISFDSEVISSEMNRTYIALIPKIPNPENAKDFRPISLCNVIYKVISKTLANRMKKSLNSLIGKYQNAFIKGRSIADNIILAHETLSKIRRSKARVKPLVAFKMDMSNAYDRLEWNFVKEMLSQFGFPTKWMNLINQCISSTSLAVLINGQPTEEFRPQRGIRQGDPISPYLFILYAEYLSLSLEKGNSNNLIPGISLS